MDKISKSPKSFRKKNTKLFSFLFFFIALFFTFCQKTLVRKEDIPLINDYYSKRTYYLKNTIKFDNEEELQKGTVVKIWIESTPSLLKVKCFPADKDRETAIGKMIAYTENDLFTSKATKFTIVDLEELLKTQLESYKESEIQNQRNIKKGAGLEKKKAKK